MVIEEILALKEQVCNKGIYIDEYVERKKALKHKIEFICEKKLFEYMELWFTNSITKQEYEMLKNKLQNTKKYYFYLISKF